MSVPTYWQGVCDTLPAKFGSPSYGGIWTLPAGVEISTLPADGTGFGMLEVGLVIGGTGDASAVPVPRTNKQVELTARATLTARTLCTLPLPVRLTKTVTKRQLRAPGQDSYETVHCRRRELSPVADVVSSTVVCLVLF